MQMAQQVEMPPGERHPAAAPKGATVCKVGGGGVLAFVTVFLSYCATIQSGVPGGDSGELISEACHSGVAHPPGYPTFIMLTKFFMSSLPIKPAVAANVASAGFGSVSALFIYLTVERFTRPKSGKDGASRYVAALCGSWAFAFSELTWMYSIGAEVFALNNALVAIIVYLSVQYSCADTQGGRRRAALWGAFFSGLALTNQHTAVFYVLVIAVCVVWDLGSGRKSEKKQVNTLKTSKKKRKNGENNSAPEENENGLGSTGGGGGGGNYAKEILLLGVSGLLGLLPYLYLIFSALTPKKGSWGDTGSLAGFFTHVTRKEYGTFSLSPGKFQSEGLVERLMYYADDVRYQFRPVGAGLAAIGIVVTFLETIRLPREVFPGRRGSSVILGAMFLVYSVTFHSLSNLPLSENMPYEVHRRFWMQPNIIIAVWIGIGLSFALERSAKTLKGAGLNGYMGLAIITIPLALQAGQWWERYGHMSLYNGRLGGYFEQQSTIVLDTLPKKALLLSFTDLNWNSVRYSQSCEQKRLDVVHLNFQIMPFPWFKNRQQPLYPQIEWPKIGEDASMTKGTLGHAKLVARFLHSNIDKFPSGVFMDIHAIGFDQFQGQNVFQGFQFIPHGVLWRIIRYKPSTAFNYNKWVEKRHGEATEIVEKSLLPLPAMDTMVRGSWEEAVVKTYFDAKYQTCLFQLVYAVDLNVADPSKLKKLGDEASSIFLKALFSSFHCLQDVVHALDVQPNTLKRSDVFKNAALSASRAITATTWTSSLSKSIVPDIVLPLNKMLEIGVRTMRQFLVEAPNDKDAPVFRHQLGILEGAMGKPAPKTSNSAPKRKRSGKKTKKKGKKRRKNENVG